MAMLMDIRKWRMTVFCVNLAESTSLLVSGTCGTVLGGQDHFLKFYTLYLGKCCCSGGNLTKITSFDKVGEKKILPVVFSTAMRKPLLGIILKLCDKFWPDALHISIFLTSY